MASHFGRSCALPELVATDSRVNIRRLENYPGRLIDYHLSFWQRIRASARCGEGPAGRTDIFW